MISTRMAMAAASGASFNVPESNKYLPEELADADQPDLDA
jgi:hypothetical protein